MARLDNMSKFKTAVEDLNILDKLQGFATNTANYQPVGKACPWAPDDGLRNGYCLSGAHQSDACCADPCELEGQYNPDNNEANFVQSLSKHFSGKSFIIDTGRNGVADMRSDCANWCNARGAGLGVVPTTDTGNDLIASWTIIETLVIPLIDDRIIRLTVHLSKSKEAVKC